MQHRGVAGAAREGEVGKGVKCGAAVNALSLARAADSVHEKPRCACWAGLFSLGLGVCLLFFVVGGWDDGLCFGWGFGRRVVWGGFFGG